MWVLKTSGLRSSLHDKPVPGCCSVASPPARHHLHPLLGQDKAKQPAQTHLAFISTALYPACFAMTWASVVFPKPGGPQSRATYSREQHQPGRQRGKASSSSHQGCHARGRGSTACNPALGAAALVCRHTGKRESHWKKETVTETQRQQSSWQHLSCICLRLQGNRQKRLNKISSRITLLGNNAVSIYFCFPLFYILSPDRLKLVSWPGYAISAPFSI